LTVNQRGVKCGTSIKNRVGAAVAVTAAPLLGCCHVFGRRLPVPTTEPEVSPNGDEHAGKATAQGVPPPSGGTRKAAFKQAGRVQNQAKHKGVRNRRGGGKEKGD